MAEKAERGAIEKLNNQHLPLEEIYSFGGYSDLADVPQEYAIALEYEVEKKNLTANAEIQKEILKRRTEGYTICFISDMHLNSRYLKELLIEQGCAYEDDHVFVSCEAKATKHEGKLYDIVRNQYEGVKAWVHYGDNRKSDYIRAAGKG
ncbi:MAG: HAD-IA family hydrolase [Bacteroides sp.]|nr:HAD-IA family hydrolase [Bacteroides sp.]